MFRSKLVALVLLILFQGFSFSAAADEKDLYSLDTLKGFESFQSAQDLQHPTKKTITYFTASWCAPCIGVFPKVLDFLDQNPDYQLILIQYEHQEEFEKGEELLGTPPFYPYGFVLNSIDDTDNGANLFMDISSQPEFVSLQRDKGLANAFQYSTLYILYALSGELAFLPKGI